jgi:cytoplasmic iron level regulating protein YaaA (DUF328/UPF0246 family)
MTAQEEFRAKAAKLKEEARLKEEAEAKSIAKIKADSAKAKELRVADMSQYSAMGMADIDDSDIKPPMMFLVQGIKDKSELKDQNGNECPDGKFYMKGTNEILDKVEAYFVYTKKAFYHKEGNTWDNSKMYRTICIRKDTMRPFAMNFNKSNTWSLSDLFSIAKAKPPIFVYNTEINITLTTNKEGIKFWKIVVTVKNRETDQDTLNFLLEKAQIFDRMGAAAVDEENVNEAIINNHSKPTEEITADDVPF